MLANLVSRAGALAVAVVLVAASASGAAAQQLFPVKFTLDWKFQGPTAFFLIAADKGYSKAEGLEVTIDAGQGSAGAVSRVASGAYDLGFADINALIEYDAANADKTIKCVMVIYDFPPFSVFALKGSGIAKPSDLVGKTLGAPVFDASYKLFPAFAAKVGIDSDKIARKNMDPALREAMLVRKEVDFISGHYFSSFLDLKAKGVKPEDIVVMRYSDFGLDFYGNGIIASPRMLAQHGDKIAGFVRATMKGMREMLRDNNEGIIASKRRDPLIDDALELERMQLAIRTNIVTPDVRKNGFGTIDMTRLERSIDQVAFAAKLARKPAASEIFTDAYLPAKELRTIE